MALLGNMPLGHYCLSGHIPASLSSFNSSPFPCCILSLPTISIAPLKLACPCWQTHIFSLFIEFSIFCLYWKLSPQGLPLAWKFFYLNFQHIFLNSYPDIRAMQLFPMPHITASKSFFFPFPFSLKKHSLWLHHPNHSCSTVILTANYAVFISLHVHWRLRHTTGCSRSFPGPYPGNEWLLSRGLSNSLTFITVGISSFDHKPLSFHLSPTASVPWGFWHLFGCWCLPSFS